MFDAVARAYPDPAARRSSFARPSSPPTVSSTATARRSPFFNPGDKAIVNRRLEIGDRFTSGSGWTTCSPRVQRRRRVHVEAGDAPARIRQGLSRSKDQESAFFSHKGELLAKSLEVNEGALRAAGLDTGKLRIGTFFTSGGSSVVPGTAQLRLPAELLRWLIRLEQGRLVDAWSSLELKRLLYFARPRYRYASSPALAKAAVFFKSGSLFECESGRKCTPYKGTVTNLMHSVAIVESGEKVYLVAMMSNILGVNSAVEHQIVAGEIERLMQSGEVE